MTLIGQANLFHVKCQKAKHNSDVYNSNVNAVLYVQVLFIFYSVHKYYIEEVKDYTFFDIECMFYNHVYFLHPAGLGFKCQFQLLDYLIKWK